MKRRLTILFLFISLTSGHIIGFGQSKDSTIAFDFCGELFKFQFAPSSLIHFNGPLDESSITSFFNQLNIAAYPSVVNALLTYKEKNKPDDWLYYQLIRKTVQQLSPKAVNYDQYTLYKWWLLGKSGYETLLTITNQFMLFYVQSDEEIYNIPTRTKDGKQYVCLNYHDYKHIDFEKDKFAIVPLYAFEANKGFSYKVTQMPDFKPADYVEKDLQFNYYENDYHFKVKINPQAQALFTNYPVVDYASYFNIPLSKETYQSLIPTLKKSLKGMSAKNGVDYLMHFTRYAFLYQPDAKHFGGEKRLTAEQTLFYDQSDCEDRVALFFCLVKEIYNLPMIVLNYPKHVTIAVQFQKPVGRSISYNGRQYSVCEPSSQKEDLAIGEMIPDLRKVPYEVAYAYTPQ